MDFPKTLAVEQPVPPSINFHCSSKATESTTHHVYVRVYIYICNVDVHVDVYAYVYIYLYMYGKYVNVCASTCMCI